MAEGTRTKNGERVWVVQREDEIEGQGERIHLIRPAEDDDVQGHPMRHLSPEDEDTEGQARRNLAPEGDDTEGRRMPIRLSPEPIDAEQGLFLAVVDTDEDMTGKVRGRGFLEPEGDDTEGHKRF